VPTAFTHAFVGTCVGLGSPRRLPTGRLAISAAVLATLPDLHVIAFWLGIPYDHPLGHRGFSHSLLFAGLTSLLVSVVFFSGLQLASRLWWMLFGALFIAGASHGLLDACTDEGLGIGFLIPFDHTRSFLPLRPLATSPIGIGAFLEGPTLSILANELIWVWLPVALATGLLSLGRRLANR
jgi:inner membrane protein